jgi:hypothetical protein
MAPATVGAASAFQTFSSGVHAHRAFLLGPAVGAPVGLLIAFLLRHRQLPHAIALAVGVPLCALGGFLTFKLLTTPRQFLEEIFVFLSATVIIEALALCAAGASGLALNLR